MNELQIFKNEKFGEVRTIELENEIYFVGTDVASILGYKKPNNAINTHVDKEDTLKQGILTNGGMQEMILINESGLYALILSSNLPQAKEFKKWVTSEVLPMIRKTGMYATDELLDNPDLIIKMATRLKEEKAKNKELEDKMKEDKPKVIFANAVATSDTSILVGDLAKILKQNGVDTGQNRLFEYLRSNGYLIRKRGESYNMPTQKSMELELFEIKERTDINPDGSIKIRKTPKVTGKGQQYFINLFLTGKVA